jgi:hypothetical protein
MRKTVKLTGGEKVGGVNEAKMCDEKASAAVKLKIEPDKIVDLIMSKQTQYYTLWGIYTVVQFTAASYGDNKTLSVGIALAVFAGVWAFNFGHLGFVLQCVAELNKLGMALRAASRGDGRESYDKAVKDAFQKIGAGDFFWHFLGRSMNGQGYRMNTFVHLFIDTCASIALLIRVDWIQDHLHFLQLPVVER